MTSARGLLWGGRALPIVAIATAVASRVTASSWRSAPVDDSRFTTALLPNVAFAAVFVTSLAVPLILLPVASSALARHAGNLLTAPTVLGRRTVNLSGVRLWRATLPGRGWGMQLVVLRSRPRHLLILTTSEFWLMGNLDVPGTGAPLSDRRRAWSLAARGRVLLVLWVVLVFVFVGMGMMAAGLA